MTDIVAGITTAIDIVKKLRELNRKVGEAEFKMLLADLTSELGDAKLEAANMKIEIARLTDKVRELSDAADRKASAGPEIDEGAYIFDDPSRHYCTGCYDSTGKKSLLTAQRSPFDVFGKWSCPVCKQPSG